MPYYVYILYSKKLDLFYVGHTSNLENRLKEHNNGESLFTAQGIPWNLLWSTTKDSYRQPEALEFKIKNLSQSRKVKFMNKYSEGIVEQELLRQIYGELK